MIVVSILVTLAWTAFWIYIETRFSTGYWGNLLSLVLFALIAMLTYCKIEERGIRDLYCLGLIIASGVGRYGCLITEKLDPGKKGEYFGIRQLIYMTMFTFGLLNLVIRDEAIQQIVPIAKNVEVVNKVVPPLEKTEFDTDQDFYYSFFKKKGLTITSLNYENLKDEGRQAVFNTIGTGCGSCHYNEIHIFDGVKELFVFYGENSVLTPVDGKGFKITQPLLKAGQSYAEKSEYQWATYKWDGKDFIKTKNSPNWVDSPQTPG